MASASEARSTKTPLTIVEWLLVAALLVACIRLVVPNFYEFRSRASDASALAVYEDIKAALETESTYAMQNLPTAFIFNQRGPGSLPSPFSKIEISGDITVHYLISLHYPGFFDLTALQVSHTHGKFYYRFVWVNGRRIEQVLAK